MSREALYYPYIGIRRIEWLKANLLMFDRVRRMTPYNIEVVPGDDAEVRAFIAAELLQPANLDGESCKRLQVELADEIARDSQSVSFLERFGPAAAIRTRNENNDTYGFQISAAKMRYELRDALLNNELAWNPGHPDSRFADYLEMHPNVGQAVMSTLAIGCAQDDGYDIVADERSGALHHCLIDLDAQEVYDSWLRDGIRSNAIPVSGRSVFEYMIAFACDPSQLSCRQLAEMPDEIRHQVGDLVRQLSIDLGPPLVIENPKRRQQALKDVVDSARRDWEQSRNSWSNFWKSFFGADIIDPGEQFVEKLQEKVSKIKEEIQTPVIAGTLAAWFGHSVDPVMMLPLSGGVAVAAYGIKTALRRRHEAATSPYRFLTTAETLGISFRSKVES